MQEAEEGEEAPTQRWVGPRIKWPYSRAKVGAASGT